MKQRNTGSLSYVTFVLSSVILFVLAVNNLILSLSFLISSAGAMLIVFLVVFPRIDAVFISDGKHTRGTAG